MAALAWTVLIAIALGCMRPAAATNAQQGDTLIDRRDRPMRVSPWLPPRCTLGWADPARGDATVWYADALEKIFATDRTPPGRCPVGADDTRPVVIKMAPGERQPFQIVLAPGEAMSARVQAQLVASDGRLVDARVSLVGYTNVTFPVNAQRRTGLFPDPLILAQPGAFSPVLQPWRAHAFWVTVSLPNDIGGGATVEGRIDVDVITATGAAPTRSFPLVVRVWGFNIPPAASANFITESSWGSGAHYLREMLPPMDDEVYLDVWYDNMREHRINSYVWMGQQPDIGGVISADLQRFTLNSTAYDRRVARLLKQGVQRLRLPILQGSTAFMHSHYLLPDQKWTFGSVEASQAHTVPVFAKGQNLSLPVVLNPEFVRLYTLVYGTIASHIADMGDLNVTYTMFIDEIDFNLRNNPSIEYGVTDFTIAAMHELVDLHKHRLVPGTTVKLAQTAGDPEAVFGMLNDVNMWICDVSVYTAPGVAEALAHKRHSGLANGDQVTVLMYHNAIPIVDLPAVRVRSFPWMLWRTNYDAFEDQLQVRHLGVQGSLSWYADAGWGSHNPWISANMHPECIPRGKPGTKHADGCALVGAGWGSLLYPPLSAMPPVLVNSIRWDLFAKGLEDAEYFFRLDNAIYQSQQQRQRSISSATTNNGTDSRDMCRREAEATASLALDRVKEVVWSFPDSRNISSFLVDTYSTNVSLLHEVQDMVALALEGMWRCV